MRRRRRGEPLTVTAVSSGPEREQIVVYTLEVVQVPVLRADGLDVFQTVQPLGALPAGQTRVYNGVALVAHKRTLVRLYVNAINAPLGGVAFGDATLRGFQGGRELPGGPLYPLESPVLTDDHLPGGVPAAERANPSGAFSFILPESWEVGTITLTAQINSATAPPPVGDVTCSGQSCATTLSGLRFIPTRSFEINPIELQAAGLPDPPSPQQVFADTAQLGPFSDQGFVVRPYQEIANVTADVNSPRDSQDPCGLTPGATLRDYNCIGTTLAEQWDQSNHQPNDATISVVAAGQGGVAYLGGRIAHLDSQSPLSVVAHETGHLYGRRHASAACGATGSQQGESWPPDQFGYLQGIGFDTTAGSAAAAGETGLFRAIFGSPPAGSAGCATSIPPDCGNPTPTDYFDIMSYCGSENSVWLSPEAGKSLCVTSIPPLQDAPPDRSRHTPPAPSVAGRAGCWCRPYWRPVSARSSPTSRTVTGSHQSPARRRRCALSRPAPRVACSDPRPSCSWPVTPSARRKDPGHKPFVTLEGFIPGRGVDSVAIADGSQILATRTRPPHKPTVAVDLPAGRKDRWREQRCHHPLARDRRRQA